MAPHRLPWLLFILSVVGLSSALSRRMSPARLRNGEPVPQVEVHEAPGVSYNNKTTLSFLFKRALSCTFNNELTNYCDNAAYCCWEFIAGADNNAQGAFCCPNNQEQGGGCCGNKCCNFGWYCDWADSLGNAKCTPDASAGTGMPTSTVVQTETDTVTNFQTVTDFVTIYETAYETNYETNVLTEQKTNVQIQTETQLQTIVESVTVLQTVVSTAHVTTTNSNGQTVIQTAVETLTLASVSTAVSAVPAPPAQTSDNANHTTANKSSTPIGAIVGGALGGAALLALAAIFLFMASRRGWFDKKHPNGGVAAAPTPDPNPNPPPMVAAQKIDSTPQPLYTPQSGYGLPAPHSPQSQRRTMSPVPAYEADASGIQYAEMAGDGRYQYGDGMGYGPHGGAH